MIPGCMEILHSDERHLASQYISLVSASFSFQVKPYFSSHLTAPGCGVVLDAFDLKSTFC